MEPLRAVLAAKFWNEEVESTRSLDALVYSVPYEPPALGLLRGSKLSRSQQLLLVQRLFSVPFMPSVEPPNVSNKNMGGVVLDRVLASAGGSNWWMTLTGRARAQRFWLLEKQRRERSQNSREGNGEWWRRGQRLLDSSLYALSLRTRIHLRSQTFLSASSELDSLDGLFSDTTQNDSGARTLPNPWNGRLSLRHKMKGHDLILESAHHGHFVDGNARYWDVPQVTTLDLSSVRSKRGGLRYRLGLHHSSGHPVECLKEEDATIWGTVPVGARPGLRAQGALSVEKETNLWKKSDLWQDPKKPYNAISARPGVTLSAIAGGVVYAHLGPQSQQSADEPESEMHPSPLRATLTAGSLYGPVAADIFGSVGITAQYGLFRRLLLDHTKVGLRLDIGAASSLIAASRHPESNPQDSDTRWRGAGTGCPSVAVSLQQQVVGPVRARIDARYNPFHTSGGVQKFQDVTYGVDCSLERLGAAKLVVWFSPDRQEGMAELRLLER